MDNENKFPEQEAPLKNTDDAFVQVGKDGSPVIPTATESKNSATSESEDAKNAGKQS